MAHSVWPGCTVTVTGAGAGAGAATVATGSCGATASGAGASGAALGFGRGDQFFRRWHRDGAFCLFRLDCGRNRRGGRRLCRRLDHYLCLCLCVCVCVCLG
ncbi:hypothetical protein MASR1M32_28700 [Rhodobacter sp.]